MPEGVELTEVPPSRHAWNDILNCPNDNCGKTFMVTKLPNS
jgi:hypothetical protein